MKKLSILLFTGAIVTAACGDGVSPTSPSVATTAGNRSTMSSSNHPPGQHPSGNPAHAPGCSNPNTVPSSDCKKDGQ